MLVARRLPFVRQWRKLACTSGDPVVEVAAEAALGLFLKQVPVGRADQAELGLLPGVAPDALVGPLLYDAEQIGLEDQRELADLVEEERPAVGQAKAPRARRQRW